jgi:hypothetical protein
LALTTANSAGTNGLTCLLKLKGARDNKFLVTHCCSTSAIALRAAGLSSSSLRVLFIFYFYIVREEVASPQYSGLYAYYIATNTWEQLLEDQYEGPEPAPLPRVSHSMLFHPVSNIYIHFKVFNSSLVCASRRSNKTTSTLVDAYKLQKL